MRCSRKFHALLTEDNIREQLNAYKPKFGFALNLHEDDPEKCRAEIWSLTTYPEDEPQPRATLDGRYSKEDKEHWGLIPLQDFSNIERIQKGMHSRGMTEIRLATRWEHSISNMHMELDRYLSAD